MPINRVGLPTRCPQVDPTTQRGPAQAGPRAFSWGFMYSSTNRARTAAATFVLGGLAIHEDDTLRLQRSLDSLVVEHLVRVPLNLDEYELHAAEMRNAKKPGIHNYPSMSSQNDGDRPCCQPILRWSLLPP